ncbi:hypothetical protein [Desulfonatronovibrio magnus]|uniref:hypothetical protein n=1 Tax=Desulfonatronovibrio magnus TaxID=698827 RepID=UPI0005EBA54D|nr:hypothetical protein [Desulfonatronovibrio magnus]
MSAREYFGGGIMALAGIAATVLGLIIHVWTIVIAFFVSGLLAAVITLIFPFLSQVYWFFRVGSNLGFDTNYCVAIMAYVGLFGIGFLGAMIASSRN